MFFGAGSIMNGQKLGWAITITEGIGAVFLTLGLAMNPVLELNHWSTGIGYHSSPESEKAYNDELKIKEAMTIGGIALAGGAIVFGYIIPFFHHKPNNTRVSQSDFPFNFELVSSNNQEVNGLRVSYRMRF
jgi:hypothetical protein